MEKIHIKNSKGQSVCSDEFWENNHNEVLLPKKIFQMDKKQFCEECAWHIGKPYFNDEELFEMGADEDYYLSKGSNINDDDIFSHFLFVNKI